MLECSQRGGEGERSADDQPSTVPEGFALQRERCKSKWQLHRDPHVLEIASICIVIIVHASYKTLNKPSVLDCDYKQAGQQRRHQPRGSHIDDD